MSNLHHSYIKTLNVLHTIESTDNYLNQIRIPKLSDKELIALNLAAESLGIDSENYLFKRLPTDLKGRIERSVYNRRKRRLAFKIEQIRDYLASCIVPSEDYHIIDSMPVEACKFSRAKRSSICTEQADTAPDFGYCAAQKMTFYGYKLHTVCTVQGVFKAFDMSRASTHDLNYLDQVKSQFNHCVLIGDRGYLSQAYQHELFAHQQIKLETPMRRNQHDYKPFKSIFRRTRKRIETLYSQLCDQFMIRRNYAKTFDGLSTRILSKITALTLIQWINKSEGRHINNIKIVIA